MQVAAADNRDVLRHIQPFLEDGIDCSHRKRVVVAKDTVRSGTKAQQTEHPFGALLKAVSVDAKAADDIFLRTGKTPGEQRFPIALEPADAGAIFASPNVCHTLTAYVEQMLGRDTARGYIIDADKIG